MLEQDVKEVVEKALESKESQFKEKQILCITSKLKLDLEENEEGLELNHGYDFVIDAAIPEIADAIAKLAIEMPKNGMGENSGAYFITLIGEYYKKLSQGGEE